MQRQFLGVIFPVIWACSGANVVSGDDKTPREQLRDGLPSWCASICARIASCDEDPACNCSGDACDCVAPSDDCPQECEQALGPYASSDFCAEIGQSYQRCLDGLSCNELGEEPDCAPTREQEEACEDDGEPPASGTGGASPDGPSTGSGGYLSGTGGATSYAGSATGGTGVAGTGAGGTGVAGTSAGGTGAVGPAVLCQASSGFGAGPPGSGSAEITCSETLSYCTDDREYGYVCVDDGQGHNWCTCFIDGTPLSVLQSAGMCPTTPELNAGCGWNLGT